MTRRSDTREAVFQFILEYCKNHEYGPSLADIAKNVGLGSATSVRPHLRRLRKEGYITWDVVGSVAIHRSIRPLGGAE